MAAEGLGLLIPPDEYVSAVVQDWPGEKSHEPYVSVLFEGLRKIEKLRFFEKPTLFETLSYFTCGFE
jgi:hypothetical protein